MYKNANVVYFGKPLGQASYPIVPKQVLPGNPAAPEAGYGVSCYMVDVQIQSGEFSSAHGDLALFFAFRSTKGQTSYDP